MQILVSDSVSPPQSGDNPAATQAGPNTKTLLWMYEKMVVIRRFEEQARREADAGRLRGLHSSIGQEAVPTGVCAQLREDDYVLGTHRSHHHCIAKGVDLSEMMAELLGKATGTNKGKGGTMHIADITKGMLGANGVVGSNIPVAIGVGLSAKIRGSDQVTAVFFGDGGANQGSLHESMNLASIWKLPVLFICENNGYAQATPFEYSLAGGSVAKRAAGYDMPSVTTDGQSALDVFEAARGAIGRARTGKGPTLIEARTYRYHGHFGADDPLQYRSQEEEDLFEANDCIARLKEHILDADVSTESDLDRVDQRAEQAVAAAVKFAMESPFPDSSELTTDVYVSYRQE